MIKSSILGLIIFICIFLIGLFRSDMVFAVNIAGGVGIFLIIVGAFLKGVFGTRNAAVASTQDKDMSNLKNLWSKVAIILGIPNLVGSIILYMYIQN